MDARDANYCPHFHRAIELIGRRWTGAILQVMLGGQTRFSDIRDSVPGLSDRLLNERLKELEDVGIVNRCTETRDVHYSLTDVGQQIDSVLVAVAVWAESLSRVAPPLSSS